MKRFQTINQFKFAMIIVFMVGIMPTISLAHSVGKQIKGQIVYLSVYPQFDRGKKMAPKFLNTTLTIRNTDLRYPITVVSIKYHNAKGELIKNILEAPVNLNSLASYSKRFEEMELRAGSGGMAGCFIIEWRSAKKVNEPLIEGIMVGTGTGRVETLVFHGRVLKDDTQ